MTPHHKIVSHDEWFDARKQFLLKEVQRQHLKSIARC
jgi:hypothetical protein